MAGAREILSDEEFMIQGDVQLRCNETEQLILFWEVSKIEGKNGQFVPYINIENRDANFTLSSKRLSVGLSYVRFISRRPSSSEEPESYDFGFVRLLPPLQATIVAPNVTIKATGIFTLDASMSRDTGAAADGQRGMTFMWLCRKENETFSNIDTLPVDLALGREPIKGGCFGYGPGKLNSNKNVLMIDPRGMKYRQTYVFQLVVSKDRRTATSIHAVCVTFDISLSIR